MTHPLARFYADGSVPLDVAVSWETDPRAAFAAAWRTSRRKLPRGHDPVRWRAPVLPFNYFTGERERRATTIDREINAQVHAVVLAHLRERPALP